MHALYSQLYLIHDIDHPQNGEIPQLFMECRSDGSRIWLPILLAYKGLFLLVGLFLAAQTYNVKIKELRDSKLIVASVFSITVISIAIGLVAFLVTNNPDVQYSVLGACILLLLTGILVLLFVTRVSELVLHLMMLFIWHSYKLGYMNICRLATKSLNLNSTKWNGWK